METVPEEWRPIPEHDGYEVSNLGRVRSLSRTIHYMRNGKPCSKPWKGRVLVTVPHKGYQVIKLGKHWKVYGVHQLVALAFHGRCPDGLVIDHVDTDKTNNRPGNLEYVTNEENVRRAHVNGLMHAAGEGNGGCKLSDDDVRQMRLMAGHIRRCDIARVFGVSGTHVTRIVKGLMRTTASK